MAPQARQVVELVDRAAVGEVEGVPVVLQKPRPQSPRVHRAGQLVKAVAAVGVPGGHKAALCRQLLVLCRAQQRRGDGVQVVEEVLFQPLAVKGGQPHDEGAVEVLPHPLLQLQAVGPVGGEGRALGLVRLGLAPAVGIDAHRGDEHGLLRGEAAQVLPRGAHHREVGLRVLVGQIHGRRHPGVDHQIVVAAELVGHVGGVAGRVKGVARQEVAPHKAGAAHENGAPHLLFPFQTVIAIQNTLYTKSPRHTSRGLLFTVSVHSSAGSSSTPAQSESRVKVSAGNSCRSSSATK